ncbi:MAG: hypothetical protein AAB367_02490 [Patescibacteria group bacterium]
MFLVLDIYKVVDTSNKPILFEKMTLYTQPWASDEEDEFTDEDELADEDLSEDEDEDDDTFNEEGM